MGGCGVRINYLTVFYQNLLENNVLLILVFGFVHIKCYFQIRLSINVTPPSLFQLLLLYPGVLDTYWTGKLSTHLLQMCISIPDGP